MIEVAVTKHYEIEIWAHNPDDALHKGVEIYQTADTIGQWEKPQEETDYNVVEITEDAALA